jgi:hypothetical protein
MELSMAVAIESTRTSWPCPMIDPDPSEFDDITPLLAASTAEASAILIFEDTHVALGGDLR